MRLSGAIRPGLIEARTGRLSPTLPSWLSGAIRPGLIEAGVVGDDGVPGDDGYLGQFAPASLKPAVA